MNDQHTPASRTGINAASTGPNPFAVHADPSKRSDGVGQSEADGGRRLRWSRLSDLHADPKVVGALVRGVDLYGHLMRAARRAPGRAVKATGRKVAALGPAHRAARAAGPQGVELS
ncbi:hypothetical protein L1785_22330 [Antribacter sp. KLBMP9083]|uniref:Uncharacterized protein n=1 Tax=Antribacter soli TaxID=2910976 RepID=A0AA41QK23_9MICO|nr:hypothetical protein [Antribacter soli]MCF4123702.1 hypothetical protein [Antribacter soli]